MTGTASSLRRSEHAPAKGAAAADPAADDRTSADPASAGPDASDPDPLAQPVSSGAAATRRHGQHSGDERLSPVIRHGLGLSLVSLTVAAGAIAQMAANTRIVAPASDAEANLGANVFARLQDPSLSISASFSDTVAGWQAAGYSSLTSAIDRYDALTGPTREFVLVLGVASAVVIVAVCRRLHLGWISTALAVGLSGVPAVIATLRIETAAGAMATFWLALSALFIVLATDRASRHSEGHRLSALPVVRWLLIGLAAVTATIAVLTCSVAALLVLGMAAGLAARQPGTPGHLRRRALLGILVLAAAGAAFWLTVLRPGGNPGRVADLGLVGIAVALGGFAIGALACLLVAWLRPFAIGTVPILVASAWPGPTQAAAVLLAMAAIGVLAASLFDDLLRHWRPVATSSSGALAVVAALAAGALVLPLDAPPAAAVSPDNGVATWLSTQLAGDAVVAVDPLTRVQLVHGGVNPDRLTTSGRGRAADFLLSPVDQRSDLPLIARFDTDSGQLGLRLVLSDSAAYRSAMVSDEADRRRFGAALAGNPSLNLGDPARQALVSGEVDARLMVALGGAALMARFVITQFTGTEADLDRARIFREVTLMDVSLRNSASSQDGSSSPVAILADFFTAQQSPYEPLAVIESAGTLTIRYAAPTQPGLIP